MTINQNLLEDINSVNKLFNSNILQTASLNRFNNTVLATNNSLNNLDAVQKNGLSRQNDIKDIITNESDRLKSKKTTIDQAILSQNRIIYFNDNNRKIYAAYLRILIVLTITLAIIWVITVIKKYTEIIPDWLMEILIIIIVAIGCIIIYNYYIDIRMRNQYNFDEINLDPPIMKEKEDAGSTDGDLTSGSLGLCIGADCCKPATQNTPGSTWDEILNKCINDPIIPPNSTQTVQGFDIMNSAKPIDAFEYTEYSQYK